MKAILMSIRPEWVYLILQKKKTIEIRKTAPKCELPIDVYIYCTMQDPNSTNAFVSIGSYRVNGRVIAKFTLKEIEQITQRKICGVWEVYGEHTDFIELSRKSCLEQDEIMDYMGGNYHAYAWHISNLQIFYSPKELIELGVKRAPQSWQYIEVEE